MSQLLKVGQSVRGESSGVDCVVKEYLGGGGQGDVYRAVMSGRELALKWIHAHAQEIDLGLSDRLRAAIGIGAPNSRFLWPLEMVESVQIPGFGYIMPLKKEGFVGIVDLLKRRVEPTFRTMTTACYHLADSYLQLHAKGMCYRDISLGNAFFHPDTGEIQICDNDNVDIDGRAGAMGGTMRFMAPEVVRGDTGPSIQTDLHSLAVLLFYLLMMHHPLEGQREADIKCLDYPAFDLIYGDEPVFIFDPKDDSNRPVPGLHDNALDFWPLYPRFIRLLFIKTFTEGLTDPQNGRVRESEWRAAMIQLRDLITPCPHCGLENIYDPKKQSVTPKKLCWSCGNNIDIPYQLKINQAIVILNNDTKLYPHHLQKGCTYDFNQPVAKVTPHPDRVDIAGLTNMGEGKWTAHSDNGIVTEVLPNRTVAIRHGLRINFGGVEGEIRHGLVV